MDCPMEDSDHNDVLGLELNRLFFALGSEASKRKVVNFARLSLEAERQHNSFEDVRLGQSAVDSN
jgi:hypothetical protein